MTLRVNFTEVTNNVTFAEDNAFQVIFNEMGVQGASGTGGGGLAYTAGDGITLTVERFDVDFATEAEATTGTEAGKVISPATLKHVTDNLPTGTGGITAVATDATIDGDGVNDPLSVANPFTDGNKVKLDNIQAGAQQNVDYTGHSGVAVNNALGTITGIEAAESQVGVSRHATDGEVDAGIQTHSIVTPAGLQRKINAQKHVPDGGIVGQVVTKTAGGSGWTTLATGSTASEIDQTLVDSGSINDVTDAGFYRVTSDVTDLPGSFGGALVVLEVVVNNSNQTGLFQQFNEWDSNHPHVWTRTRNPAETSWAPWALILQTEAQGTAGQVPTTQAGGNIVWVTHKEVPNGGTEGQYLSQDSNGNSVWIDAPTPEDGGLAQVVSDDSLSGVGTQASPLGVIADYHNSDVTDETPRNLERYGDGAVIFTRGGTTRAAEASFIDVISDVGRSDPEFRVDSETTFSNTFIGGASVTGTGLFIRDTDGEVFGGTPLTDPFPAAFQRFFHYNDAQGQGRVMLFTNIASDNDLRANRLVLTVNDVVLGEWGVQRHNQPFNGWNIFDTFLQHNLFDAVNVGDTVKVELHVNHDYMFQAATTTREVRLLKDVVTHDLLSLDGTPETYGNENEALLANATGDGAEWNNIQGDWTEADTTSPNYIKSKPHIVRQDVAAAIHTDIGAYTTGTLAPNAVHSDVKQTPAELISDMDNDDYLYFLFEADADDGGDDTTRGDALYRVGDIKTLAEDQIVVTAGASAYRRFGVVLAQDGGGAFRFNVIPGRATNNVNDPIEFWYSTSSSASTDVPVKITIKKLPFSLIGAALESRQHIYDTEVIADVPVVLTQNDRFVETNIIVTENDWWQMNFGRPSSSTNTVPQGTWHKMRTSSLHSIPDTSATGTAVSATNSIYVEHNGTDYYFGKSQNNFVTVATQHQDGPRSLHNLKIEKEITATARAGTPGEGFEAIYYQVIVGQDVPDPDNSWGYGEPANEWLSVFPGVSQARPTVLRAERLKVGGVWLDWSAGVEFALYSASGEDGTDGTDGTDGNPGAPGVQGIQGIAGVGEASATISLTQLGSENVEPALPLHFAATGITIPSASEFLMINFGADEPTSTAQKIANHEFIRAADLLALDAKSSGDPVQGSTTAIEFEGSNPLGRRAFLGRTSANELLVGFSAAQGGPSALPLTLYEVESVASFTAGTGIAISDDKVISATAADVSQNLVNVEGELTDGDDLQLTLTRVNGNEVVHIVGLPDQPDVSGLVDDITGITIDNNNLLTLGYVTQGSATVQTRQVDLSSIADSGGLNQGQVETLIGEANHVTGLTSVFNASNSVLTIGATTDSGSTVPATTVNLSALANAAIIYSDWTADDSSDARILNKPDIITEQEVTSGINEAINGVRQVPGGGTESQVLTKGANDDFGWEDSAAGSGGSGGFATEDLVEASVNVTTDRQWVGTGYTVPANERTGYWLVNFGGSQVGLGGDPLYIAGGWHWVDVEDLFARGAGVIGQSQTTGGSLYFPDAAATGTSTTRFVYIGHSATGEILFTSQSSIADARPLTVRKVVAGGDAINFIDGVTTQAYNLYISNDTSEDARAGTFPESKIDNYFPGFMNFTNDATGATANPIGEANAVTTLLDATGSHVFENIENVVSADGIILHSSVPVHIRASGVLHIAGVPGSTLRQARVTRQVFLTINGTETQVSTESTGFERIRGADNGAAHIPLGELSYDYIPPTDQEYTGSRVRYSLDIRSDDPANQSQINGSQISFYLDADTKEVVTQLNPVAIGVAASHTVLTGDLDMDDITEPGEYSYDRGTSTLLNGPGTNINDFGFEVIAVGGGDVRQWLLTTDASVATYERTLRNDLWLAWRAVQYVPSGGTTEAGQVLTKTGSGDDDYGWVKPIEHISLSQSQYDALTEYVEDAIYYTPVA